MMKTRKLGNSDLYLSVLGMGCWQYGGGEYWGKQNQSDVNAVVHRAIDEGINFFDTAEVYNNGESEKSVGLAIRGKRNQVILGSKVSPNHAFPGMLTEHCNASLQRLNTDYIDLYMLHWPFNSTAVAHFADNKS